MKKMNSEELEKILNDLYKIENEIQKLIIEIEKMKEGNKNVRN